MKVLVTGAGGMLGCHVVEHCLRQGDAVAGFDRQSLDITNAAAVAHTFDQERPEAVINCAAWTDVDGCERDEARAFAANAHAVETLALMSRRHAALLVTVSTDYVFDGTKDDFYTQRDDPNPTSVYGRAKLAGERRALAASARTIVVRTGWLYGANGKNFLSVISDKARGEFRARRRHHSPSSSEPSTTTAPESALVFKAISDAYGMPTRAADLAVRLRELAQLDLPGTYHVVAGGEGASYAEFTRTAFDLAGVENIRVEEVSFNDLRRPAPRPQNSRMRCLLSEAIGLAPLPRWQDALRATIES